MERKMKFLSAVMKLYLIIWTITPALGIYEKCNSSLGLSELDINKITVNAIDSRTVNSRGNVRLSDDWPVFRFPTLHNLFIKVDLGEKYNITGMIIKGEEGNGTADLDSFSVLYSNNSYSGNMTIYKNEKGKNQEITGTTKEENIRYEPFYPAFVGRYIMIRMVHKEERLFGYVAIQIDVLGCNITREETVISTNFTTESTTTAIPCNNILDTTLSIKKVNDNLKTCANKNNLQIIFDENDGPYEITKVKITITNDNLYKYLKSSQAYGIAYMDESDKEHKCDMIKREERSRILSCKTKKIVGLPVKSLRICIYSNRFSEEDKISIYNYTTVEVRGCPIDN